ncbi:MAG: HAD family hydrolase [Gemmataceae bacterium]|nr:HAD family hydrolase [Gemmataceae bacterium]
MSQLRPAVFLDRDGTLNVERSYITRPEDLVLLPGVAAAVSRLQRAGFVCVVVTNQAGVGRGLMTHADLDRVHAELARQLAHDSVTLDGIYFCTFAPSTNDQAAVEHPERKPAPGMLLRAACELHLDLTRSWMIGDTLRDILAGQGAGCRECILVRTGHAIEEEEFHRASPFILLDDLSAAVDWILAKHPQV